MQVGFRSEEARARAKLNFRINECSSPSARSRSSRRGRRELVLQIVKGGHEEVLASLGLDENWQG